MMDAVLAGIQLTSEQRTAIKDAAKKDSEAAVREAKMEFNAQEAASRKLELFDPETATVQDFVASFEPFRSAMNLDGVPAMQTFLTYLRPCELLQVTDAKVLQNETWDNFADHVIQVLSSPRAAVFARVELRKATQLESETISQFGQRISRLARIGYSATEEEERTTALKDTLVSGVRREEIAVQLVKNINWDYKDLLKLAVDTEASFEVIAEIRRKSERSVAMVNSVTQPTPKSDRSSSIHGEVRTLLRARICYICRKPNHLAKDCRRKRSSTADM